ncbi:hypothetical protein, partial [Pseudomonas sp. PA-6-4F]|uniref:hypothetical protein n=1 Tax=Pseudomonas sp. PA-6-4F TaxID=2665486 RepID=UPI003FA6D556
MDMISHQTVGVYFYAKCVLKLSKVSHVALVVLLSKKGTDLFTTIQPRPPLPSALNTNACNPLNFFNETSSSGKLPP